MARAVDDLVARGMIVRCAGHWELRAEIDEIAVGVPEGLRQFVARTMQLPRRRRPVSLEAQPRDDGTFPCAAPSGPPAYVRARTAEA
jgi:hypothetical protein